MTTFTRAYATHKQARRAVEHLEAAGFTSREVGIVARMPDETAAEESHPRSIIEMGLAVGTVIGGAIGFLTGLGVIAIPGLGPVVATGWLAATALGAAVGLAIGGLIGAIFDAVVSEQNADADVPATGETLVIVTSDEASAARAAEILRRDGKLERKSLRYGNTDDEPKVAAIPPHPDAGHPSNAERR
jgi:hypothetical protein